jgi:hypothetical protein
VQLLSLLVLLAPTLAPTLVPTLAPPPAPADLATIIATAVGSVLTILAGLGTNMLHNLATKLTSGVDALRTELKEWRKEMEARQDALERRLDDIDEREASRSRPHGRAQLRPKAAREGRP